MIFKRKPGPILRWSRLLHCLIAATSTAFGAHLWGDAGAVAVGFGVIAGGLVWEISNRYTGGWHPYADALDFWAFVLGALLTGLLWAMI